MMRALVGVLAIASVLLLAGTVRAPLTNSMEAPSWSAGDFWVYRFNSTFEGSAFLNGTLRADIVGVQNQTVRGIAQDLVVVETGGSGSLEGAFETPSGNVSAHGSWNLTGEQLFNEASRKIVKTLIRISAAGHVDVLDVPFTLQWTNSTSNRVVADAWRYPIPVGYTGSVTLNSSMNEDLFLVFDSNPPLIVNSSVETFDYAPAAGNNARTQTFNSTGTEVSRTELVSYRYQASMPPNTIGTWVIVAGVAIGVAAAAVLVLLIVRRRRRERTYTPPSLRDPPT